MATGNSEVYSIPYPLSSDSVNVHGDVQSLVERLEVILPPLGVSYFQIQVLNNSGADLDAGTPVYATGYTTKTTIAKSLPSTSSPILGLTKTSIANNSEGIVVVAGVMENINTSGFSNGDVLYVGTSGGLTSTRPATGSGAVGIVAHAAADGIIIVEAKGNGTWGALKSGLA
jgi:hypothetical protein